MQLQHVFALTLLRSLERARCTSVRVSVCECVCNLVNKYDELVSHAVVVGAVVHALQLDGSSGNMPG